LSDSAGRHRPSNGRRRPSLLEQSGGPIGLLHSSLPATVFVFVNSLFGLTPGILSAVASVVAFTVFRAVRGQPLKPALAGIIGVAISSFIAYRTGNARDYFLPDIWYSLVGAAVLVLSIVVRRPLVGVVWSLLNQRSSLWRKEKRSRFGYDIATVVVALVFAARFVVQHWLYEQNSTGWLAFAKIAMNYPLWALALIVVVWAVRRSDRHLAARGGEAPTRAPRSGPERSVRARECWAMATGR